MYKSIWTASFAFAALLVATSSQAALISFSFTGTATNGTSVEALFTMDSDDIIAAEETLFSNNIQLTSAQFIYGGSTRSFDITNGYYGDDINGETIEFRASSAGETLQLGSVMGGFADISYNSANNQVSYSGIYNDPVTSWTEFAYSGSNFTVDLTSLAPADGGFLGWINSSSLNTDYTVDTLEVSVSAVPVPAAIWLFGSGLIGLATIARRRT